MRPTVELVLKYSIRRLQPPARRPGALAAAEELPIRVLRPALHEGFIALAESELEVQ